MKLIHLSKTTSLILFILISSSCGKVNNEVDSLLEVSIEKKINDMHEDDVEIINIDNCEYIVFKSTPRSNRGFGFMSHKGNCNNPYHSNLAKKQAPPTIQINSIEN